MTEEQIFEMYGRLAIDHSVTSLNLKKTLKMLQDLKNGTILLDSLTVNDDGWELKPDTKKP